MDVGTRRAGRLIGFGASHFGRTVVWVAADLYALYALTRIAGLSDAVAGGVFLLVMLFSAACDLVVGGLIDRHGSPGVRTLIGAAGLSSVAFAVSLSSGQPLIAVSAAFVFRLAYAVYDVPHNALVKRLSGAGGDAVVTVSTVRFLTGAAASLTVAGLAARLVAPGGQGLGWLAVISAGVAASAMVAYAPVMARLRQAAPPVSSGARLNASSTVLGLIAVALLGAILGGLVTKALAFLGDAELGSPGWTGRALAILTTGRLAAAPIWAWAGRHLPLVTLLAGAFGVVGLGGAMFAAAPASIVAVEAGVLILGAGFSGVTVYSWALLPDLSGALGRGRARDPIHTAVAAYTSINKLALGVGGAAIGTLLAWIGEARTGVSLSLALGLLIVTGSLACAVMLIFARRSLREVMSA